ncbi:MAG TPA: hypothetical protein VG369_05365, partial [Humibacter sp.]|nr:hypothetical protein [Humibacter sp.]
AKRRGKSLQEYLSGELRNLAEKPTVEEWFDRARRHVAQHPKITLTGDEIVEVIHEDRAEREALLLERVEGKWAK